MARSGLDGPYLLSDNVVSRMVINSNEWSSAAVFALGVLKHGRFVIQKVGHADGDLGQVLKEYMGKYKSFRFRFCRSTRSAYNKECYLYHEFKPRDNLTHPIKPKNTKFTCPVMTCELFE